ncbi:MAG: 3'-5' exonuclease [Trueperaceae bacterium]
MRTTDDLPVYDLPVYTSRSDAPRDFRTADELAEHGLTRLGAPAARLIAGDGATVALYSTSEARRLRDGMWPSTRTRQERPADARAGTVRTVRGALLGADSGSHGDARRLVTPARSSPLDWIAALFDTPFVVLDTETTGLGARAEVIEIAVVAADGTTLYESMVWPHAGQVPADASGIHGLTLGDLKGAPTWPAVLTELDELLRGHRVVAWNAPFDDRIARQSSRAWRVAHPLPGFECAMRAYAYASGVPRGSMRLERAAATEGVLRTRQTHRSADDARLTLALLRRVMERRRVGA